MPSTPVHLPMNHPPAIDLGADDPAHQWPLFLRRIFANEIAAGNERLRFGKFGVAIVMNRGQRFSLFQDRKSTRLNSSHTVISYAVFCLIKKNIESFFCRINTAD